MKKICGIIILLAIVLSACVSTNNQESLATVTSTPVNQKTIRLYFPNHTVASLLNKLMWEQNIQPYDFDLSSLDPRIHVEVSEASLNYECAPNYAYIEIPVSDEEYTPENAIRMLLSYQFSDEDRELGFYHELNGFGLELVSVDEVIDEDGEISAMLNQNSDDYMEFFGHEKTQSGGHFVKLVMEDPLHNYFQFNETDAYQYYLDEAFNTGLKENQVDVSCWFYTPLYQIEKTLLQFYPTYKLYNHYISFIGTGNNIFYYADNIAFSGCGNGTSCESMLTFDESALDQTCYVLKLYGRDNLWCNAAEQIPNVEGTVDETMDNLQNLTNVCLDYPDTYVCAWPRVQETLK